MSDARPSAGFLRGAAFAAALVALCLAGGWLGTQLNLQAWPRHVECAGLVVLALLATYVVAMALPFMPGIEIGIALMLVLGGKGILLVYICTQLALALSFLCGRLVPQRTLAAFFRATGHKRALGLLAELERTAPPRRLDFLAQRAPSRWAATLLRHRYLAFAVALNVPGNALIGGAGGIGLLAGMSGVLSFPRYAVMIAAATTPVPAFLLLGGAL
jgi:hypothetical protein